MEISSKNQCILKNKFRKSEKNVKKDKLADEVSEEDWHEPVNVIFIDFIK